MKDLREFAESVGGSVLESVGRTVSRAQERTPLPADLLESDDAYLAIFDAPGAQSSDVQVRLDGRTVEVRLDRFREYREEFEMRFPGRGLTLDGRVTLPADASVEGDDATATLQENGTLHVRVPKTDDGTTVDVTETDETSEEGVSDEASVEEDPDDPEGEIPDEPDHGDE